MNSKEQAEKLASKIANKIASYLEGTVDGWNEDFANAIKEHIPLAELLEVAKAENYLELKTSNLESICFHLETKDNGGISREALRLFLVSLLEQLQAKQQALSALRATGKVKL